MHSTTLNEREAFSNFVRLEYQSLIIAYFHYQTNSNFVTDPIKGHQRKIFFLRTVENMLQKDFSIKIFFARKDYNCLDDKLFCISIKTFIKLQREYSFQS